MNKKILRMLSYLKKRYKSTFFERGSDPFFVLIFTVLSQRTRDENTEKVAYSLLSRFPTPETLANAKIGEVEALIKASGFYRVKALRIQEISRQLIERFGGDVPSDRESLLSLPGVGPKTAGCVQVYAFRTPAIPVDTHVHRISNRLGIIDTKTPKQSEIELMKVIERRHWILVNELLVKFGQDRCAPIRPWCSDCGLADICTYRKKGGASR